MHIDYNSYSVTLLLQSNQLLPLCLFLIYNNTDVHIVEFMRTIVYYSNIDIGLKDILRHAWVHVFNDYIQMILLYILNIFNIIVFIYTVIDRLLIKILIVGCSSGY